MNAHLATVFGASLLGSLHCAGMCGGLVAFACGTPAGRGGGVGLQAAYHGGRLAVYLALGALAGSVGQGLERAGNLAGWQGGAALVTGLLMVGWGLATWLRLRGVRWSTPGRFGSSGALYGRLLAAVGRLGTATGGWNPLGRALGVGLATAVLPCGWLWTFALAAAGTGSAGQGALAMGAFWLGTLPALAGVGALARSVAGPLRRRLPEVAALAVVAAGLVALLHRGGWAAVTSRDATAHHASPVCCHDD